MFPGMILAHLNKLFPWTIPGHGLAAGGQEAAPAGSFHTETLLQSLKEFVRKDKKCPAPVGPPCLKMSLDTFNLLL